MSVVHLSEPVALSNARREAHARFDESGWPTRRLENWRFTNLAPLTQTEFGLPAAAEAPGLIAYIEHLVLTGTDRLVFVNGRYSAAHSRIGALPPGVELKSFAEWAPENPVNAAEILHAGAGAERAFVNLNTALHSDGVVLIVPENTPLDRPILVLYWNEAETASAFHLRMHVHLKAGASAEVIEAWGGNDKAWGNVAASIRVDFGAKLGYYKLQDHGRRGFHTAHRRFDLAEAARCDSFTLTLGAALSREDNFVHLSGPKASLAFHGGYLLGARQEATMATTIVHEAPDCQTHEVYKGVLAGRAHGVFQGKITVERAAQKTDARQLNKTVLLGDRAVMDTKPELEIFADDVKCAHGASVGDLDETALFYLRSRGLTADVARRMLIEAFVTEAVDLVQSEPAREFLRKSLEARLAEFGEAPDA